MSAKGKAGLGAVAALAAGAVAGAALEGLLFRRLMRRSDPEVLEPIGRLPGETHRVESFDGTAIHVRSYGREDAPLTLVFAHGVLESHVSWHYQLRDLTEFRLVAYDARGHGGSGPARGPHGNTPFTEYAQSRDLAAVVEGVTAGPVVLVGHSMGGMTVQALWQHGEISRIRDRVRGVALVNTTFTADIRGWRGGGSRGERAFERVEDVLQQVPLTADVVDRLRPRRGSHLPLFVARLVFGRNPSPKHIATSVAIYQAIPADTIAASIDLARFDAFHALPLIDVPALVVTGTKDILTPMWLSEEIALRVPDAELVVFEGCGHMAQFERYDELNDQLRKFAERLA